MTIRPATLEDLPRLVAMGQRFRAASVYAALFADNPVQIEALFRQLLTGAPATALLVAATETGLVQGMIGLVTYPQVFSGERMAGEVFWWVNPSARGSGKALWVAAERWAAERGAVALQMMAPADREGARLGRLYQRRGYRAMETTYQAPVTAAWAALTVVDDVLEDFAGYAAAARQQPFRTVEPHPGVVFHGMAEPVDETLTAWIRARWPGLTPTESYLRRGAAGQAEPHFIHADVDRGDWTAIAYLTEQPQDLDGTMFWRWRATGAIRSLATTPEEQYQEWAAWRDLDQWEPWTVVTARPNRLVLFPSCYFHSRTLQENYGAGDTARLIQIVFGTGGV